MVKLTPRPETWFLQNVLLYSHLYDQRESESVIGGPGLNNDIDQKGGWLSFKNDYFWSIRNSDMSLG